MVWGEAELLEIIGKELKWLVFLEDGGAGEWRGGRVRPMAV
jgi:hypothetical protein